MPQSSRASKKANNKTTLPPLIYSLHGFKFRMKLKMSARAFPWQKCMLEICLCAYNRTTVMNIAKQQHHNLLHHLHEMLAHELIDAVASYDKKHAGKKELIINALEESNTIAQVDSRRADWPELCLVDPQTRQQINDPLCSLKSFVLDALRIYIPDAYIIYGLPLRLRTEIGWQIPTRPTQFVNSLFFDKRNPMQNWTVCR